jgi:hypothetical protein
MDQQQQEYQLRIKSAMIVFALEKSLGNIVKRHAPTPDLEMSKSLAAVESRDNATQDRGIKQRIEDAVAASYLEEIMNLSLEVSRDSTEYDDIKKLSEISTSLGLYTIRNAIAHANRPFPESHWYRTAALASDSTVERLNLNDVRLALHAAVSGKLAPPPDEWMQKSISFIANTLPGEFQHESTGLLGRQKEARELENLIRSRKRRLISVVAPGGTGKTALILDVLRRISLESTNQKECKGIIFTTLKQTSLTADGIKDHTAAKTIEELKSEIFDSIQLLFPDTPAASFKDVIEIFDGIPLIVCIDNLETLLRDKPESFNDFFDETPSSWIVIVTSRIPVDGARTLPLGLLAPESAKGLAYKYFSASGENNIGESIVERICTVSKHNPLAIRLTVDRYKKGFDLVEATSSVQADIVAFSYKNLVETLSDTSNRIMECLFVCERLGRSALIDFLKLSTDEATKGIIELISTSLAVRIDSPDEDVYELTPPVRDLLRELPRDLKLRESIGRGLNAQNYAVRQHQSIQKSHNFSKYSENYIPESISGSANAQFVRAIRLLRTRDVSHPQFVKMLRELDRLRPSHGNTPIFATTISRLFSETGDQLNAVNELRNCLSEDSPTPRLMLAELIRQSNPNDALAILRQLRVEGWTSVDKSDAYIASRIWYCFFRSLTEMDHFDELKEACNEAKGSPEILALSSVSLAYGLIREASSRFSSNKEEALSALHDSSGRLTTKPDTAWRTLVKFWATTRRYLIKEFIYFCGLNKNLEPSTTVKSILRNLEPQFSEAYTEGTGGRPEAVADVLVSLRLIAKRHDPGGATNWFHVLGEMDENESAAHELESKGYEIATITRVPDYDDPPSFVFARTKDNMDIFVHRQHCGLLDWVKWVRLRPGSLLAYRSLEYSNENGRYPIAKDCVLV